MKGGNININLITMVKYIICVAGAGFVLSDGFSLLIPVFTATATVAYLLATFGDITTGTLAARGSVG